MQDIIGREVNLGDLVLTYKKNAKISKISTKLYALMIADDRAFNDIGNFKCDAVYLVQNPSPEEQQIKAALHKKYMEYTYEETKKKNDIAMVRSKLSRKGALCPGDILTSNSGAYRGIYLYLGKLNYHDSSLYTKDRNNVHVYLRITNDYCSYMSQLKAEIEKMDNQTYTLNGFFTLIEGIQEPLFTSQDYKALKQVAEKKIARERKCGIDAVFYESHRGGVITLLSSPTPGLADKLAHVNLSDFGKDYQIVFVTKTGYSYRTIYESDLSLIDVYLSNPN